MDDAGTRVERSTDGSNRELLIGQPASFGQDPGTVTTDIDGRCEFKRGIVWTEQIHKHFHGNANFLPGREMFVWHLYLLWAGKSNVAIVTLRKNRAMVLSDRGMNGFRQAIGLSSEKLFQNNLTGAAERPSAWSGARRIPEEQYTFGYSRPPSCACIVGFSHRAYATRPRWIGEDSMKKEFALDPGSPKRLRVTYPGNLANAEVLLDGQRVMGFSTKAEFHRGTTCKLPDGSILTVRFGPIEGIRLLKGVHVVRNGVPLPGSAADTVPKWAWVFMAACALIPVVTLGGALPALIGFGGVGGTLTVSRLSRWSVGLRAGVSALITLACWGALGLLVTAFVAVKAVNQANPPAAISASSTSSTDKLIHDIGVTYYKHGHLQSEIDKMKEHLYDECDRMQPAKCTEYLEKELVKAQISANVE